MTFGIKRNHLGVLRPARGIEESTAAISARPEQIFILSLEGISSSCWGLAMENLQKEGFRPFDATTNRRHAAGGVRDSGSNNPNASRLTQHTGKASCCPPRGFLRVVAGRRQWGFEKARRLSKRRNLAIKRL